MDQTRSELRGQASNQQSALADKLQGWASELGSMASKSDESGLMTEFAQEASRRVGEISHWLDNHEPADLLDEVKRFARRRPVAFLTIAAAAGVLAGRATRGAVAANTSVDSDRESAQPGRTKAVHMTTRLPRRASPRTAPAATRTATTPRVTATPAYRQKPAMKLQALDRAGRSTTPVWQPLGSTPPKALRFRSSLAQPALLIRT